MIEQGALSATREAFEKGTLTRFNWCPRYYLIAMHSLKTIVSRRHSCSKHFEKAYTICTRTHSSELRQRSYRVANGLTLRCCSEEVPLMKFLSFRELRLSTLSPVSRCSGSTPSSKIVGGGPIP